MALSRIAASIGRIDGVRSARVCERVGRGVAAYRADRVKPEHSPQYADTIRNLVTSDSGHHQDAAA